MPTYYYKAPRTRIEDASAFGVVLRKAFGRSSYYFDEHKKRVFKEIGVVDVYPSSGKISAWPMDGLTPREIEMLIGTAELAFRTKPTKATGWSFKRRKNFNFWRTYVSVPVHPDNDHVAHAIAEARSVQDMHVQRIEKQMTEVDDLSPAEVFQ